MPTTQAFKLAFAVYMRVSTLAVPYRYRNWARYGTRPKKPMEMAETRAVAAQAWVARSCDVQARDATRAGFGCGPYRSPGTPGNG